MSHSPVVPWILPDDAPGPTTELVEHEDRGIEIPVYGSLTVDEARYLEHFQEQYGLGTQRLPAIREAVYHLLLLRFGLAAWTGQELVAIKGKLPTMDQTLCEGDPPRLLPTMLLSKVYAFFIDEFSASLGKPRTALKGMEESLKDGTPSTGNYSSTTPATDDLQGQPLDSVLSTSSDKPLPSTKTSGSTDLTSKAVA